MRKLIPAIALVILLVGCKPKPGVKPTVEEAAKIVDKAEASFTTGDTTRIMEHYAPDAVFFDPGVNDPTRDRATATKWTETFVAMKPTSYSAGDRVLQVLDAHTIISSGIATMDISSDKGPTKIRTRYTDVYQQQPDGTWLIVHEHLSNLPNPAAAR